MNLSPLRSFRVGAILVTPFLVDRIATHVAAHEKTRPHPFLAQAAPVAVARGAAPTVPLEIELVLGETGEPVAGLVRITAVVSGKPVQLPAHLGRPMNWFSLAAGATVDVPPGEVRIEACHGLETEITTTTTQVSVGDGKTNRVRLPLRRFYDRSAGRLVGANTHLHLQLNGSRPLAGALLRSRREAEDYLRTTANSDGLDLVYVSHLVREGESQNYVSNQFTGADLLRWSSERVRFINGEEHRHEGGRSPRRGGPDELRYGHVLFLDLPELVQPVSYGAIFTPGAAANDAVPMRRAIAEARNRNGTVIWCHGRQGSEDVPNWIDGVLHAQNIFDGGSEGTVETTFYPYLNAGLRVPFSTGTDWGSYDLSRVYVPIDGERSSRAFLHALTAGRSFITNGTLLEFDVEGRAPGDTIELANAQSVRLRARGIGRENFGRVEIVFNGKVVAQAESRPSERHFVAESDAPIAVSEPGWFALRIPTTLPYTDRSAYTGAGANLFGKALFAHTSAVYVTVAGESVCQPSAIEQLIKDLDVSIQMIEAKGAFASAAERETLLAIYKRAAAKLQDRLKAISL